MINIINPSECCGCTACASVCPHNAITMKPDDMGFLYPVVNYENCVECGVCESVCSFNDNYDTSLNLRLPEAYGARHKDMSEVMKSRSGAAFVAISDYILKQGGVVYGAGYKDHFRVAHKRATTKKERDEFRGSKYVQSDLTGIFRQVKQDLKNGFTVLFSGTPCQTSGLKKYIGNKLRTNLILIDIVCHGVPGPYIWRDYLDYLEKQGGRSIVKVNFRDKENFGWNAHVESFEYAPNQTGERISITSKLYTSMFYQNLMFRKSCGSCHFCNTTRPSDITLADFWGWEKTNPQINNDDKGLSLILCNTTKGREIFETVKNDLIYFPVELKNCIQTRMEFPTHLSEKRDEFEKVYAKRGFEYAYNRYCIPKHNIFSRIINKLKGIWIKKNQ